MTDALEEFEFPDAATGDPRQHFILNSVWTHLQPYEGEWAKANRVQWEVHLGASDDTHDDWDRIGRITEYGERFAAYPDTDEEGFSSGRAWCASRPEAVLFLICEWLKPSIRWEPR